MRKSNAVFLKEKDPFYKKQKYKKGLTSVKETRGILHKVNPDVSMLHTHQDFMKRSRETQRELDNESSKFFKEKEEITPNKNLPMSYLVREFQKSLNGG